MRVEWFSSKNDVQYPGVSTLPHKKWKSGKTIIKRILKDLKAKS